MQFEILTENGFKPFKGVRRSVATHIVEVVFDNKQKIRTTLDHKIKLIDSSQFVEARTLKPGMVCSPGLKVVSIRLRTTSEYVYDALDVGGGNHYLTNGVTSHNCEFLGSSNTLIDGAVLKRLVIQNPIKSHGEIKIYHEPYKFDPDIAENGGPDSDGLYMIVVDTSRGVGGDFSAFIVFDVTQIPYKVAATYHNNWISPMLYPNIINQAAKYYNNAVVLIETNDIGGQVADILGQDLEYEHILYSSKSTAIGGTPQLVGGFGQHSTPGVRTTKTVKRVGCSNFKSMVESDRMELNDKNLIEELFRFTQRNNSYEAEEGHDDLVMCCVLFGWAANQSYFKELTNVDVRRNLYLQNLKAIEDSIAPFVFDDGQPLVEESVFIDLDREGISFDSWYNS